MQINTYFGGSCAVSSINNLGEHKNAVDAMKEFCRQQLGRKDSFRQNYGTLACHYVFSAGPEVAAGLPGSSHHSKAWVKYGTEFAQFITDNNLGVIGTSGQWKNIKHHASTTSQAWLWHPDQTAMEAWWDHQCGLGPAPVISAPKPVQVLQEVATPAVRKPRARKKIAE